MDKSEFGSMKQMSSHQIQRTISTSIVLKGGRRRSMRKKGKRNLLPSNQAFLPLESFQLLTLSLASNGGLLRSSLGPCFACRKFGHHQTKCRQTEGSVPAYKPRRCEAQVLRMNSGTCVDSNKCLFDCAFFRDFECEASFSSEGLPSKLFSARSFWISTLSSPLFVQNIVSYGYALPLKAFSV